MLPLVIPGIDRFFHRNIDWLRLRWVFWGFSTAYVVLGLCMVFFRGSDMLDTQFRGGTQIVMQLKLGADEKPVTKTRRDIEEKLKEIGANASAGDEQLHRLAASSVLPVNPQSDGVTSDQFVVKSLATDATTVRNAIAEKFGDLLETQPALEFKGVRADTLKSAPVYQIVSPTLGEDLARPEFRDDVKSYLGGVAIVVEDIQPPQPLAEIKKRLERTRTTTEFSDTLVRQRNVIILEGDERAVKAAAIVVRDPAISVFDDEQRWSVEVESREWKLTRDALSVSSTAASVEVFSPTIARTFTAQAIVAFVLGFILIGIYIWVRFGSVSFALGGIIPLVHDVLTGDRLHCRRSVAAREPDHEQLRPQARNPALQDRPQHGRIAAHRHGLLAERLHHRHGPHPREPRQAALRHQKR
jgi:preprotein translocase subunit SecF